MSSDNHANPLDSRRKAQEEDYFRKKNAEAAEKLRAFHALQQTGVSDEGLVKILLEAGFDSDGIRALFLQPLVEVAWADGRVQSDEKEMILKFAKERGIEETSLAHRLLLLWIEKGEKEKTFLQAKTLLGPMIEDQKTSGEDASAWILGAVEGIAKVTNNLFGFGFSNISKEEKEFIQNLSSRLDS
jgi:hypothetical protein